jgi:hypothetical protein
VRELAKCLGSIDFGRDNHEPLAEPITWIRDDGWCLKGRYRINVTILMRSCRASDARFFNPELVEEDYSERSAENSLKTIRTSVTKN